MDKETIEKRKMIGFEGLAIMTTLDLALLAASESDFEKAEIYFKKLAQTTNSLIGKLQNSQKEAENNSEITELTNKIIPLIQKEGITSIRRIQWKLNIGFKKAKRIIKELERKGILKPATKTVRSPRILYNNHCEIHRN